MREEILSVDILLPVGNAALEEEVTWAILEAGVTGFEQHDDETFRPLPNDPRPLPAGATRWRINLEGAHDPNEVQTRFRAALSDFPQLQIEVWTQDISGYLTAWMKHFKPTLVSNRIVVHPPWDAGEIDVPIRIEIDPGMAFGTGTHETTKLCLHVLDSLDSLAGKRVLDVGAGSGILSIAAAKLGAAAVEGIDIDKESEREATRNAKVNSVGDLCTFHTGQLSKEHPPADLVVANILPHILTEISDELVAHMLPGGSLILSGILLSEEAVVHEHFAAYGLTRTQMFDLNDWCAMVFEQPSV